ncbi:hypothetical protein FO519_000327 [Halicephalobus sp. NKZ332]|nr:hypothetical protein FO519_000327 [Halicephalobus sp. NKZ332]
MTKDRLAEFKKIAVKHGTVYQDESEANDDLDGPSPSENTEFLKDSDWADIDRFLSQVNNVESNIDVLESLVMKLGKIHKEVLQSPGTDPTLIQNLNDVNDQFTSISKKTNHALNLLTQNVDQATTSNSVQDRIRKNQAFTLKKRLALVISDFHAEQLQYKEKCKESMRNYLKCVDQKMTDDEINEAVESGKLYSTKSLMLGDRDKQMLLLRDVENRHQDIIKLEKSIAELHEMFQDIAMLIDAQGEILNNIEMNVATATEYTKKAHGDVVAANKMKNRNLMMKIALLKSDLEKYRSKLLYQSLKRGILENDIIIGNFAKEYLPSMSKEELMAYDKIINGEHMEWDLFYYVSDKKPPPPELESCKVFHKIKNYVRDSKGLQRH